MPVHGTNGSIRWSALTQYKPGSNGNKTFTTIDKDLEKLHMYNIVQKKPNAKRYTVTLLI